MASRASLSVSRSLVVASLLAACGGASPDGGTTPVAPRRDCTAALRFEEPDAPVATDTADRPRTRVSLVLICEREPTRRVLLGDEVGACYGIDDEGALLRARCWWAGEGAMIEVVRDADALVVRRAAIEESTGVGAFEETTRLDVPPGAQIQAL